MNVSMELICVSTIVITLMEVTSVTVNLVINCPMVSLALISMSVILTMVVVVKCVSIKLDLTIVSVILVIHLTKMDMDAQVRHIIRSINLFVLSRCS